MKTIIVPTDFSPSAYNAARYAMHLAKETKSHIILCNAMLIPVAGPMAGQIAAPIEDYDSLKQNIDDELQRYAQQMEERDKDSTIPASHHPTVTCKSEVGPVSDVVCNMVNDTKANMVVMGMSGARGLSRVLLGSKSRDMIEAACFPVLLVPAQFIFRGIKKIAFATDLSVGDIEIIHSLAGIARCFNAEILITHITDKKYDVAETKRMVDGFLSQVSDRVNYPKIYYRHVKSMDVDHGLNWLAIHSMVDMMAMVHRPHDVLDKIFKGSHTQKLAKHITVPLLVFPNDCCAVL
jgi:nucleotide-binding universal stress UspA family protein